MGTASVGKRGGAQRWLCLTRVVRVEGPRTGCSTDQTSQWFVQGRAACVVLACGTPYTRGLVLFGLSQFLPWGCKGHVARGGAGNGGCWACYCCSLVTDCAGHRCHEVVSGVGLITGLLPPRVWQGARARRVPCVTQTAAFRGTLMHPDAPDSTAAVCSQGRGLVGGHAVGGHTDVPFSLR